MQAATLTATPTSKANCDCDCDSERDKLLAAFCCLAKVGLWNVIVCCVVCGVRPVRGVRPRRKASAVGHSRKMRRSGAGRRSVNWLKASPTTTTSCGLNPLDVESF